LYTRVITFLLGILVIHSCTNQGWIVANVPIGEEKKFTNTVFTEIVDADSVTHWYHGSISIHSNWCYIHNDFEKVEVK
jgi:predicted ester cyclase